MVQTRGYGLSLHVKISFRNEGAYLYYFDRDSGKALAYTHVCPSSNPMYNPCLNLGGRDIDEEFRSNSHICLKVADGLALFFPYFLLIFLSIN